MKKEELYAGFWLRFVAFIADFMIFAVLGYLMELTITFLFPKFALLFFGDLSQIVSVGITSQRAFNNLSILCGFWFIFIWLYYTLFESSRLRGTPGKLALHLKVETEKGKRADFAAATKRFAGKLISLMTAGLLFITIMFTKKKQGIHDKLARTVVIRTKDCVYVTIACILTMFFWVPLLNFAFLAGSILLSAYQILLIKRDRKTFGGLVISIVCFGFAVYSLIVGVRIFILFQTGQLG